jgi:hypothetical protein
MTAVYTERGVRRERIAPNRVDPRATRGRQPAGPTRDLACCYFPFDDLGVMLY